MLIKDRVDRWETIEPRYPVEFQLDLDPNQPIVDTNPIWLGRVLDVLIENAVEATRESEKKLIQITIQANGKGVTFTIKDTGKGIDKELLPALLRKSLALPGGRGRGLYIARLAIEMYGGTVEVADTTTTGTTIRIWLPLSGGARGND